MSDVDAAGIVYFAAPYRWLEDLFSGWLTMIGHPLRDMLRSASGCCPSVASAAHYTAPLTLDDEVSLALYPSSIGRTSFSVTAVANKIGERTIALRASSWHVWGTIDHGPVGATTIRPQPLPAWLREGLGGAQLISPATTTRRCAPTSCED
jgi:acyl-CoA thioesterase FadM